MRQHVLTSVEPAAEPVTLIETKGFLRVDGSDDDQLISGLIASARQAAESFTRRAFITQTLKLQLDAFPTKPLGWWDGVREGSIITEQVATLELPRPPLVSVTSVTYFDVDDTQQEFAASNYFVDTDNEPGRLILKAGKTWPSTRSTAAVIVTYKAGYGADATKVPRPIRDAILHHVAYLYDHRGTDMAPAAQSLLAPYRVLRL